MSFRHWLLNTQCATPECTEKVPRWVLKPPTVLIHGKTRVHWPNIARCPSCQKTEEDRLNALPSTLAMLRTSTPELGPGTFYIK